MDNTIAFLPLRGGSQSIPKKNIKDMLGHPLAAWCLGAAQECNGIDNIVIATDSEEIKEKLRPYMDHKTIFHDRDPRTATHEAATEDVLLEYFEKTFCKTIVLLQATSPLTTSKDLTLALKKFHTKKYDSILSVVREHKFYWNSSDDSIVRPMNYNPMNRPRRQDFRGSFVENGAFYIVDRDVMLETRNRLGGRIGVYEMDSDSRTDIDEPNDWKVVEILLRHRKKKKFKNIENVKLIITDIDGVWTDSGMYYSESGDELKKFNTRDGMGVKKLREKDIEVAIVTSEKSKIVANRARKLNIKHLYQGITNKGDIVKKIQHNFSIAPSETVYIGDDINDLSVAGLVAIFFAPADASLEVKIKADFICTAKGGHGAFREMTDFILDKRLN